MARLVLFSRIVLVGAAIGLAACSLLQPSSPKTASAQGVVFGATLSGRDEVPPANSRTATGTARLEYDRARQLVIWDVSFSNLTSAATAAHIHGPADPDGNAGVVLTLPPRNMFPIVSPLQGSATVTEAQAADLMAGKWYINIHTAGNPNGEIRGQLIAK
jgi:hypothetical protein